MNSFEQRSAQDITDELAARIKARRKERRLTQAQLARRAGMSLSTYKRFEANGAITLANLARLAIALDAEDGFDQLFARRGYASIQEVINEAR